MLLSGQLPQDISSSDYIELFPLRDGAYILLSSSLAQKAIGKGKPREEAAGVSAKEQAVLHKLASIRFEKRTLLEVGRLLSKEEKEVLDGLVKKGMVEIFKGGKYARVGVYNLSDKAFLLARSQMQAQPAQPIAPIIPISSPLHLEKHGWMVIESESEAKNFGNSFPDKVRSGEVMGQRAFDRRYYFVTKAFFQSHEKEVLSALFKSDKTAEEIAQQLGLEVEGCRAILVHLLERGEVMEKHKGCFSKV